MSKYFSYYHSAISILKAYEGEIPFSIWLKKYFSVHKKYGSKDRKEISNLCFCFFRSGNLFQQFNLEEKIILSVYLCSNSNNNFIEILQPEYNKTIHLGVKEKLNVLQSKATIQDLFKLNSYLSKEIDSEKFATSFLHQPDLFIRVRPSYEKKVEEVLNRNEISYYKINDNCFAFSNATSLDEYFKINKEIVIQDYSSQSVSRFLKLIPTNNKIISIWDCCAASGGKSILASDIFSNFTLTVSDIRTSILNNLKIRFREAGIKHYESFVTDLSSNFSNQFFDLIICDAPCSGSGTWSRTPEQLQFFTKEKIEAYKILQQKIISNSLKSLRKNGYFLYITCSVFSDENEEQVKFIQEKFHLKCIQMELIKGYELKADSMFAALFTASTNE